VNSRNVIAWSIAKRGHCKPLPSEYVWKWRVEISSRRITGQCALIPIEAPCAPHPVVLTRKEQANTFGKPVSNPVTQVIFFGTLDPRHLQGLLILICRPRCSRNKSILDD